jgi:alkanesulfonate monooxygenase SsuD/methylene tetrahydromethanopterin reductase-like flavin-dependent oxidoreductase (luciferase family)
MEVGVHFTSVPRLDAGLGDRLDAIAGSVEELGLHSVWAMDQAEVPAHLDGAGGALPEAFATLAWLAARTSHVELGVLVVDVTRREPELTVQAAATLDALSGGRAWLGLGIPRVDGHIDPAATEAVIALARERCPRVRILVGGGGERVTLPLVARSADACNLLERIGEEEMRHKLDLLDGECRKLGRPRSEILTTTFGAQTAADDLSDRLERLEGLGVDLALFDLGDSDPRAALQRIAQARG